MNRNEGLHSVLRSKLNRLLRRTKGYTKSLATLVYSAAPLRANRSSKFNASLC